MLTKHERRVLSEIERATRLADPEFALCLDGTPARRHRYRMLAVGLAIVATMALLALGVVALLSDWTAPAVTAAAVVLAMWTLLVWSYRRRC